MEGTSLVVGGRLQVFEEVRLKYLGAVKVGGDNAKETPATLTAVTVEERELVSIRGGDEMRQKTVRTV